MFFFFVNTCVQVMYVVFLFSHFQLLRVYLSHLFTQFRSLSNHITDVNDSWYCTLFRISRRRHLQHLIKSDFGNVAKWVILNVLEFWSSRNWEVCFVCVLWYSVYGQIFIFYFILVQLEKLRFLWNTISASRRGKFSVPPKLHSLAGNWLVQQKICVY